MSPHNAIRKRLPTERPSLVHHFHIEGASGATIIAGIYEDGTLGELFIKGFGKEGSTIQGLLDGFATTVSVALQYGVPLAVLADKFVDRKFEPRGMTDNPDIKKAKSIYDYIFRWLTHQFPDAA